MSSTTKQRGPVWRLQFQVALASYLKSGYVPWLARHEAEQTADAMLAGQPDEETTGPSVHERLDALDKLITSLADRLERLAGVLADAGLIDEFRP